MTTATAVANIAIPAPACWPAALTDFQRETAATMLNEVNEFYSDMPLTHVVADALRRNRNRRGWHPTIHHSVAAHIAQTIHDRQCRANGRIANPSYGENLARDMGRHFADPPADRREWDQLAADSYCLRQRLDPVAALERMLPHESPLAGRVSDAELIATLRDAGDAEPDDDACTRHPEWLLNRVGRCQGCAWDDETERQLANIYDAEPD